MHYNIANTADPIRSAFAYRVTMPLWLHGNIPRVSEDGVYVADMFFATNPDLDQFLDYYAPVNGDVLESFSLDRRVLFIGVQITIDAIADVRLRPVTNSGGVFDQIDCSNRGTTTYTINGGKLDTATKIADHSMLIEEPDYLGFRIETGAENIQYLQMRVQLVVRDEYDYNAVTNSSKVT